MQTIDLTRPGRTEFLSPVLVGCVGSGDLEVLIESAPEPVASISIKTSVVGSEVRWQQIVDAVDTDLELPAMKMSIHDFGATPGVIRLRMEQALELARKQEVPA
ncbi:malonate decarboxylase acyl carrier protein [uncultured Marinobacter sp.]|uniref:malonate decarboxylase acyl carrier protein n=1 Tax=uncultured Marinobacter sp. TaxID=187379 RepID=UPI0025EDA57D|nr:malonate decarboxylase acyl carrier protein [uncultured Marinobacter sp.]